MIRITQILCPVDFSEPSRRALDYAAAFARHYEARLTLLHVSVVRASMDMPALDLTDEEREQLLAQLRVMAARLPPEVAVEVRVEEAEFADTEIVAQAAAMPAGLLVLGTHGRSGFSRLFIGSVTEKVIHKASCPTLVVPPRAGDVSSNAPVQFKRIVCPVDFSAGSLGALALAIAMAKEADARLTLVHVIEMAPELFGPATASPVEVDRIRAAAEADVLRRLRELIPADARAYCTVETAVVEGSAHRELVRFAADAHSDLIVIGAHGRGAVDRLVFGSTTHQVIRAAGAPVLVVRS